MKTTTLGQSDLVTTRLIYGCMRTIGVRDPADMNDDRRREAYAAIAAALDAGYNHFAHADIYGRGECERVFGAFLRDYPGVREKIIVTTKCGIRWAGDPDPQAPHRYDFSSEHIVWSCEQSLQRLGVEQIDVYLLHRPDVLMEPDDIAHAFDQLQQQGKVKHFGVSNFTPSQTALLQDRLSQPLVCNQLELHLLRMDPFEDGTLDDLYRRQITPTSWGPVAGGRLGDEAAPALDARQRLMCRVLDDEAAAHGTTRSTLAMAWLLRHPSNTLPIVGSRRPDRIQAAAAADGLTLSREAWYRLYVAARGRGLP